MRKNLAGYSGNGNNDNDNDRNDNDGWTAVGSSKTSRRRSRRESTSTETLATEAASTIDSTVPSSSSSSSMSNHDHSNRNNNINSITNRRQFMIMLVGLPGSGKSSIANTLVQADQSNRFVVINQDTLKTRIKCERKLKQVLSSSHEKHHQHHQQQNLCCPIIDRCNFDRKQRQTWYDIVAEHNHNISSNDGNNNTTSSSLPPSTPIPIHVIVLQHVSVEECIRRCQRRTDHQTLQPNDARRVVQMVQSQFELPTDEERLRTGGSSGRVYSSSSNSRRSSGYTTVQYWKTQSDVDNGIQQILQMIAS